MARPGWPAATVAVLAVLLGLVLPGMPSAARAASLVEWTLHKTPDGAHPDGNEQSYLWLMNRARRDPAAEGAFLSSISDPLIRARLAGFGVDLDALEAEFAGIAPRPPAAFDARLYEAALAHSLDMMARDRQDHQGQRDRVTAAGFRALAYRGNVYAFSQFALEGHAAFNVDWGPGGGTGMQPGRPHRRALMSIDAGLTNVGLAVVPDTDRLSNVGPFVVTGNYAEADPRFEFHHNRFLVGTVWLDADADGLYDPGEGVEGVAVVPDRGPYYAVTAAGGGYALPILAPGTLRVAFEGAGVPWHSRAVEVGGESVLLDSELGAASAAPLPVPEPGRDFGMLAAAAALALVGALRARKSSLGRIRSPRSPLRGGERGTA